MKKIVLTAALGAACLALGACSKDNDTNAADANGTVTATGEAEGGGNGTATTTASAAFPKGARIVEENGVTYRIDPDGTSVALTATDSRIVVENGVRFRVDPDGTRVRIDPQGAVIDLPDVDVGINAKGHPDIDVKTKGDNNAGPD